MKLSTGNHGVCAIMPDECAAPPNRAPKLGHLGAPNTTCIKTVAMTKSMVLCRLHHHAVELELRERPAAAGHSPSPVLVKLAASCRPPVIQ